MLNKVMLIGRLGQDPDVRYTPTGTPVVNFNVATDDSYTSRDGSRQERTEWHRVVVFDRLADNCKTYLTKGSLVYVEGRLQTRKWQDQQGQDRYTTEIVAQRVKFLDRRGEGSQHYEDGGEPAARGGGQRRQSGGEAPRRPQQQQPADQGQAFPSESSDMDVLPF